MRLEELLQLCCEEKKTVCLVGGGGKSTLMDWLAGQAAAKGKKVLVGTTTHIRKPAENFAVTIEEAKALWAQGHFAVIGEACDDHRLCSASAELFDPLSEEADLVLLEADGAKLKPCKIPDVHEPVIPEDCGLVIGLMGMTALGRPLKEVCFRFEKCGRWLEEQFPGEEDLTEEVAAAILGSVQGTRKYTDGKPFVTVLNQCDHAEVLRRAEKIAAILQAQQIPVVCTSLWKVIGKITDDI